MGGLELLALHDERIARVVRQHRVIELRRPARRSAGPRTGRSAPPVRRAPCPASSPSSLRSSSVAGCVVAARGSACGPSLSSNSRTGTPRRASSQAHNSPTGPPPAISTRFVVTLAHAQTPLPRNGPTAATLCPPLSHAAYRKRGRAAMLAAHERGKAAMHLTCRTRSGAARASRRFLDRSPPRRRRERPAPTPQTIKSTEKSP